MSITFEITQIGALLDKKKYTLSKTQKKLLKKTFSINTRTYRGRFNFHINKYKETNNFILLPRFGILNLCNDKKFIKKFGYEIKIINKLNNYKTNFNIVKEKNSINLTKNQNVVIDYILTNIYNKENIKKGLAGTILKMEAGQGKSFIAMKLIKRLGCKTLIVVHNISLLDQWYSLLKKYFPNLIIGKLYGKKKTDGHIVIAVIKTLLNSNYNIKGLEEPINQIKYLKLFHFMIFDESHLYCSKVISTIFNICQRTFMLGLSATPKREIDKFDPVSYWNLGKVLDSSKIHGYNKKDANRIAGKVIFLKYLGPNEFTKHIINKTNQMVSICKMLEQLIQDPYRINLIIKKTYELLEKGHNIFIFADRRKYLLTIKEKLMESTHKIESILLENLEENLDNKIIDLMGGSSSEKVKIAEKKSRVILTTYQYLGTGKSIPKMTSIILATPRKTGSKQFINRIFRLGYKEHIIRDIIDIVDWRVCMKNQWYHRKKFYIERNFIIEEKKINYNNIK